MTNFTALYDANVLYPLYLRDLLMNLALTDLYRAKWSDDIHEEWIRNRLANHENVGRADLERIRDLMNAYVHDCLVNGYEDLIPALSLPDSDDRHVLAAAIASHADVIVTVNLGDFPADALDAYGLEAQHPDDFVMHLVDLNEVAVLEAVKEQLSVYSNPVLDAEDLAARLRSSGLAEFSAHLESRAPLLR